MRRSKPFSPRSPAQSNVTLRHADPVALDAGADQFVSTFVSHAAAVIEHGETRITTILEIKALVVAALRNGGGSSSNAWKRLHQTIIDIVETRANVQNKRSARYLQSFILENDDLRRNRGGV